MIPFWLVGIKSEYLKVIFPSFWEKSKGKIGFRTGGESVECEPCSSPSEIFYLLMGIYLYILEKISIVRNL